MTWPQQINTPSKAWKILGIILTTISVVAGSIYAAGQNTEKFKAGQSALKVDVKEVKVVVKKIKDVDLPRLAATIEKNHDNHTVSKSEIELIKEKIIQDQTSIIKLNNDIQAIKQDLVALKTQQKADSDWIKESLKRIEAKK